MKEDGKKIRMVTGLAALVLALALPATAALVQSEPEPAAERTLGPGEYLLGNYHGCVAVYGPEGSSLPQQVTDIEIALLPRADRNNLDEGILVESRRELVMLLEDLGS